MATKVSNLETYREALQQLSAAMDAVDQAHATLKDINLAWVPSQSGPYGANIAKVYSHLESIVKTLEQIDCDECWRPVSIHPHADCKEWQ